MTHQTIGGVTQTVRTVFGIEDGAAQIEDPFAPVVARARSLGIERCERVLLYAAGSWGSRHHMLGFVPDHGGHIDPDTGKGTHGIDTPEDMDVQHFYGLFRGKYVLGRDC